jgi:hypothetical protein
MGCETIEQCFRSLIPVPFEMRVKCVFCALGEVYRPTLEVQQKRVAKDPVACLYISMRKNEQWCETLIVFLVLSTRLSYSALAVYMHPPQHLAETLFR